MCYCYICIQSGTHTNKKSKAQNITYTKSLVGPVVRDLFELKGNITLHILKVQLSGGVKKVPKE